MLNPSARTMAIDIDNNLAQIIFRVKSNIESHMSPTPIDGMNDEVDKV